MASEHSFDISGEVSIGELKNALELSKKELNGRYDFQGIKTELELNEQERIFTLSCSSEKKLEVVKDILISKLIKREINPAAIIEHKRENGTFNRLYLKVQNGIESENAKKITQAIKASKLKVSSTIRGTEIRVMAKQIDDLQAVMKLVKGLDLELNISFKNFK
ncbi:YajQ family cyclic di-GMP-binding protein [Campylobacter sp. MIT 21-1685]|uniref:YajQ family cyclic di-GMP-binding protein n=1 Tax=unclassified Campylobacter TaxID=2593542 RepID=UPI00224B88C7|nr:MULTISPECIES: YajQ family cyclic di-GMP-binding protein [unclassified Campylobacter]MCX2683501.1 YajQ family cyclic di-GMP-binding protein [Campylobacter sp. MIT 21-1684]MCX2751782.1 YajQ family cyclic di-GMP-binding protein [Campylobacter sp. MIT 21-1682]MCX2807983.1 YajQ family cyclic di-GMP-binding protein [Campylobacter sp. MIT 21-1685]